MSRFWDAAADDDDDDDVDGGEDVVVGNEDSGDDNAGSKEYVAVLSLCFFQCLLLCLRFAFHL